MPDPQAPAFDERSVRLAQGALGVVLLAAFVFRIPLLVPIAGINEVIGAAVGPQAAPLHLAYQALLAHRLPAREPVAAEGIRAQHVLAVVLLGVASLAFLAGVDLIGWLFTLLEAGVAVSEATLGVNAAVALRERLNRD